MNFELWQILANQAFDDELYQSVIENSQAQARPALPDAECSNNQQA
jgi:hypothetical protein